MNTHCLLSNLLDMDPQADPLNDGTLNPKPNDESKQSAFS
jgi:hypothetical protein